MNVRPFFAEARQFITDSKRAHVMALSVVRVRAILRIILSLLSSSSVFLMAGSLALFIDEWGRYTGGAPPTRLPIYLGCIVFAALLPDVLGTLRNYNERIFWLKFSSWLEITYARARLSVDVATNEQPKFQDTVEKAEDRSIYPALNMLESQLEMVADVASLVIASAILMHQNPLFLPLLFAGALPRLFVGLRYGKNVWTLHDLDAEERRRFYFLRRFGSEHENLMETHLLGLRDTLIGKLSELVRNFLDKQIRIERRTMLLSFCALSFSLVVTMLVYLLSFNMVLAQALSLGGFLFLVSAIGQFEGPLQRIFIGVSRQYEFSLFAHEVFRILDTPTYLSPPKEPKRIDTSISPEIIFEGVSFHYPDQKTPVLTDINLKIPRGGSLALVGINGAGKTTLVKLLCRFYDPTEGRILINGIDLREIDLKEWYGVLGVLFQYYPTYKSFTAEDGITFGDATKPPDHDRAKSAAELAGAKEFVEKWEHGFEEIIGKEYGKGVDPSRGQTQRLALARIFYRDPRCLVLDEPTASVDAEAEKQIFDTIEGLKGKTRILISHRFSTVRHADQICVLNGGKIGELGDHEALMRADGEYARLFNMQAKGYLEETAPRSEIAV